MNPEIDRQLAEALKLPVEAMLNAVSRTLSTYFRGKFLLETEQGEFGVEEYAKEGHCTLLDKLGVFNQYTYSWYGAEYGCSRSYFQAWTEIEWDGRGFELIIINRKGEYGFQDRLYLVGESKADCLAFFEAVCKWNSEVRGEVLVYNGDWCKSEELFNASKIATLDNLVLQGTLKEQLRDDFVAFFDSRKVYEQYRIPWKRGVLLLGPPGNGKTHALKALVNLLDKPCLYVSSLKHRYKTSHGCIHEVFERARQTAPCVLVLEDLDSMLNDENRSYFLNEMDGFASNAGIMTVATTNHPDRLDPAIMDRPSRFDRKYMFHLPDFDCRRSYLQMCSEELEPALRLTGPELDELSTKTDGFSFAYLKELFLSAMMEWISQPGSTSMSPLMAAQVDALLMQMRTAAAHLGGSGRRIATMLDGADELDEEALAGMPPPWAQQS